MDDPLARRVRYNAWANATVFAALSGATAVPARATAALAHVLETEIVWTRRIDGRADAAVQLWGNPPQERVAAWLAEAREALSRIATRPDIAGEFAYRNSRGEPFRNRIDEVLDHVLLHSAQYRGEAAGLANAGTPVVPDLDFIFWLRAGEPPLPRAGNSVG